MDALLAARLQMTISLAFHMVFAALGVGMPLLMLIAEGLWLRTGREEYRVLARTWSRATGILFAVGAVSGTALAFELWLLWPKFMEFSGPMIGGAFALESYAFFIEAIFLGLYLYGWDRLRPLTHWLCGIPVALGGAASSVLVVSANAWMQHPTGFRIDPATGKAIDVDPVQALFNPAWAVMATHSTLSCYVATAFAVGGVYAVGLLHRRRGSGAAPARSPLALRIALAVGLVFALAMPVTGHLNAEYVSRHQPTKLAAMEAQFETERRAPLRIGGWPDPDKGTVDYVIEIPGGLSILAYGDPNAEVKGLNEYPRDLWPNVRLTHLAFQLMVASGFALLGVAGLFWLFQWRRRGEYPNLLLALLALASPLGFVALETGWIVTEVGRQPWIIRGVMRVSEAVTPAEGVQTTFVAFTALYLFLAVALSWLLWRLARTAAPTGAEVEGEAAHAA